MKLAFNHLRSLTSFWILTVLCALAALAYYTFHCYFADSEIWGLTLAHHFSQDLGRGTYWSKPLFYAILWPLTRLAPDDIAVYIWSRAFFLINAGMLLWFTHKIAQRLGFQNSTRWLLLSLLSLNTVFWGHAIRVRADLLATTFLLAALCSFLAITISRRAWVLKLSLVFLAVATTFKAAIPIALSLLVSPLHWRRKAWMLGIFVVLLFALGMSIGLDKPLAYFFKMFQTSEAGIAYFSQASFEYIEFLIWSNPFWTLAFVTQVGFYLSRLRTQWRSLHWFEHFCAALTLWVLFHPERLPFFLASLLPFLTLWMGYSIEAIWTRWTRFSLLQKRLAYVAVLLFTSVQFQFWVSSALRSYKNNSNSAQLAVIQQLQEYARKNPSFTWYDVIGLLPQQNRIYHFLGPGQRERNDWTLQEIQRLQPDAILYVDKMLYIEPDLSNWLQSNYQALGNGVWWSVQSALPPPSWNFSDSLQNIFRVDASQ